MLAVFALGATLWAVASLMRVPMRVKLALLALIWVAVVAINVTLPVGASLRLATGGDARPWLVLAGIVALVWVYRAALGRLRGRAQVREAAAAPKPTGAFTEAELNRYARHIMLRELGGPGQRRLKDARVLVVGAGGLGSPALLYLAAAGVGTLGVIDDDRVDSSNLQRQIIHTDDRIGQGKVFSAKAQIAALNPFVTVRPYMRRLTPDIAADLIAEYDLVLDGTDNFDTRYLVNRTCAALGKPLIAGAITQWEGQLSLYDPARGGACYECLFPERPAPGLVPTCAEAGVVAALPGVIGTMMALEAIKHLTGAGEGLRGRLMIHDGLYGETRIMTTHPRSGCAACGHP
jgi:molybdopterin/thiamine biosynthesis adenylyltransferase